MSLQILNLSIDIDYAFFNGTTQDCHNYDDLDSYSELIIEKIMHDDNYTSENDDDSGSPQDSGIEKYSAQPLYFEQHTKARFLTSSLNTRTWRSGLHQDNNICKGFFTVFSPPPDFMA